MWKSDQTTIDIKDFKSHIENNPYTQTIEGVKYTYSILPKKQKSFFMTN